VEAHQNNIIGCGAISGEEEGLIAFAGKAGEGVAVGFRHERLPLPETAGRVVSVVRFPGDSDWFSGHFPDNPIVPGVALIALAANAVIERERGEGRSVTITGVRRVRFRLPVRPEDEVTLEVTQMPDRQGPAYSFTLCVAGEAACSGLLTAAIVAP
jgi:3-hydroxyacyl-[acyl-carrier-protein] dehydratase